MPSQKACVWRVQKARKILHFSSFSTSSASSILTVIWLLEKKKKHMQVWHVRQGVAEQHIPAFWANEADPSFFGNGS